MRELHRDSDDGSFVRRRARAVELGELGAFAATLCHVYRERGGASCGFDRIRFAAITPGAQRSLPNSR